MRQTAIGKSSPTPSLQDFASLRATLLFLLQEKSKTATNHRETQIPLRSRRKAVFPSSSIQGPSAKSQWKKTKIATTCQSALNSISKRSQNTRSKKFPSARHLLKQVSRARAARRKSYQWLSCSKTLSWAIAAKMEDQCMPHIALRTSMERNDQLIIL